MLDRIQFIAQKALEKTGLESRAQGTVYLVTDSLRATAEGGRSEVYIDITGEEGSVWYDGALRIGIPEFRRLPNRDRDNDMVSYSGGLSTENIGTVPIVSRAPLWATVSRRNALDVDWENMVPPLTDETRGRLERAYELGIIRPSEIQFYNLRG